MHVSVIKCKRERYTPVERERRFPAMITSAARFLAAKTPPLTEDDGSEDVPNGLFFPGAFLIRPPTFVTLSLRKLAIIGGKHAVLACLPGHIASGGTQSSPTSSLMVSDPTTASWTTNKRGYSPGKGGLLNDTLALFFA
jgi:hypothetical protein